MRPSSIVLPAQSKTGTASRSETGVGVAGQALASRCVDRGVAARAVGEAADVVVDQAVGEDRDAAVAEAEHVLGDGAGAAAVVDPHDRLAGRRVHVDAHDRQPALDGGADRRVLLGEREDDHAIDGAPAHGGERAGADRRDREQREADVGVLDPDAMPRRNSTAPGSSNA